MKSRLVVRVLLYAVVVTSLVAAPARQMLPDGSVAELQSGARIGVKFSDEIRSVTLHEGEARFWVAKDRFRPFLVQAGCVEIRAVGTAFSVARENYKVSISVFEGRAAVAQCPQAVSRSDYSRPETIALVQPNRPVVVLDFKDAPLAEAVSLLNQYSSARLVIPDGTLARIRVNITMLADTVDPILRLLTEKFYVEVERRGTEILLNNSATP